MMAMTREGIRGWLLAYMIGLALLLLHGIELTVAAIIIFSDPSIAGLHSFIPLGSLLFYVITNAIVASYTIVLFFLMRRKSHSAIVNNIVFNALSVSFVIAWRFLGEKSHVGTVVDVLPGLVGLCYFLISKRVKTTFTAGRR
jgi:Protein of unknown function (DUF2569)